MNKSVVIVIGMVWLLCTMYFTLSRIYALPYSSLAMAGSWIASALLLICIVVFIRKHGRNKA